MGFTVNEFDFTTEQLNYLEQEMRKYKVPFLYKIVMGALYKWAKYFYPIIFLVIIILVLIHNFSNQDLFPLIKGIGLVVIFNLGRYVGEYDIKKKMDFITYCFMREKEYSIEKGNT